MSRYSQSHLGNLLTLWFWIRCGDREVNSPRFQTANIPGTNQGVCIYNFANQYEGNRYWTPPKQDIHSHKYTDLKDTGPDIQRSAWKIIDFRTGFFCAFYSSCFTPHSCPHLRFGWRVSLAANIYQIWLFIGKRRWTNREQKTTNFIWIGARVRLQL